MSRSRSATFAFRAHHSRMTRPGVASRYAAHDVNFGRGAPPGSGEARRGRGTR